MALYRSIGAALEDDNSGTNPIDVRKDLGGLFVRAGVLPGGASPLVTGTAGWAYNLGAAPWVTQTATGDGYHLWGNDGAVTVGTSGVGGTVPAAPGAGLSRIDILWVRHPSNGENGDATSAPAAGVTVGTAASSPTAPALPAGAFELARNTMTSAATTTASTGNTITQTAPYTAPRGGVVLCRNLTERDALTASATASNPITVTVAGVLWTCNDATTWRSVVTNAAGSATASTQTPTTSAWTLVTLASDSNLTGGVTRVASGLTVPVAGVYAVSCAAMWPTSSTGRRGIGGGKNSTVFGVTNCSLVPATAAGSFGTAAPTVLTTCAAGDIVNLYAYQDSGSALTSARLDMWRVA